MIAPPPRLTRFPYTTLFRSRLAEKGKSWLGAIQSVGPAAKRGRIGHAIRVFECRRGFFPGIALHKAPSQSLTARQQTVVGVWRSEEHTSELQSPYDLVCRLL